MATEINLGGTIYISSKHAAEKTGYTQDYIGQLARGGQIEAKRVSGMWYILEESLRNYKAKADQFVPTPPQGFAPNPDKEVSVSFDGKDYISTGRAAKLTGYNQDYVGQLARSGEVLSRQVGNRWYIDRESLLAHKKQKDDLLAAVQVESVGLAKPGEEVANSEVQPEPAPEAPGMSDASAEGSEKTIESVPDEDEVTHFEYVKEEAPLIPEPAPEIPPVEAEEPEPMPEFPRRKVTMPAFEEHREEASEEVAEPIAIRKIQSEPAKMEPTPLRVREPEPAMEEVLPPEPAPKPEMYFDSLDRALDPDAESAVRTTMPEVIEEHIYVDEGRSQPRASKKGGKGGVFIMGGIAVAAAVGTLVYIGTSLGFLNLASIISGLQASQNAAVTNSVVENNSSVVPDIVRNLFSKEIVYMRE